MDEASWCEGGITEGGSCLTRQDLQNKANAIDSLFDLGKLEEGRAAILEALEASKDDPTYHLYFQAEVAGYLEQNSKEQGRLFLEALHHAPDDLFLMRVNGVWQLMNGKVWTAVRTFDRVLALDPSDADTLRCIGIAHSRLDRDRKAITFYTQALASNPNDSDAMRQIGVSYSKLGEDREALDWFRRALAVNEVDYDSMRQMGISLAMLADYEGALQWLRLAQTVNPQDYETRLNMALVLKKMRGEETCLERVSIQLGRWISRVWGKLLDRFGLR